MKKSFIPCFLAAFILGCDTSPQSNTPEYDKAHGVVEGAVNEIQVGNTRLRFPPNVSFSPYSSGKIKKGRARQIRLGLSYPEWHWSSTMKHVGIVLEPGYEPPEFKMPDEQWKHIQKKPDLELVEYRRERDDGSWGYVYYVALNEADVTPKGNPIHFYCRGTPGGDIQVCMGAFVLGDDLLVRYHLNSVTLPHWQKVHRDVVLYIEPLIVN